MPADKIKKLKSGEQVRVTSEGEQILIPGIDPELADIEARKAQRMASVEELRQAQREIVTQKKAEQLADPAIPPEKSIF